MRAYMVYSSKLGSNEGACLVFAHTGREAKTIGYPLIKDWFCSEWTDIIVKWLKDEDWLFDEADAEKIKNGEAHVIESPKTCHNCLLWGIEFRQGSNICVDCYSSEHE